ncbi:restriction endonuclease subunit S [Desulfogranum japonicum]|uniref:restriction endonuclease subunit S n=1 Tax=Desulfogranum japonicum TaxID=231447 RepID=UPI00068686B9|nr:restriction endonuclease subunit S [Desulfogranum japonicum]
MTTFKSLREIVTFRGGGTPSKQVPEYWHGDIPWASVKDFTSTSLSDTQDFISQDGLKNSSANLIPKGHVIIPTRMSLGKAAINTVDLAINQDLRALVPKLPLDTQFLLHAVLALKDEIVKKGSGATVKGITQEELYKLEIAFPPLDDQKRIAHLLGKVEGLIVRRKHHLQQLDDLLKSVFLEMFGDPVRNEKGWDEREIGKSIKIKHGFAFKSEYFSDEGPYVLLTPGNFFETGGFRDRGDKQKYYTGETPEEYILEEGSLLLAMTEQAPGLLGSPLIVPESNLYLHNQRLGLAVAQEPIQSRFLFHLFNQKAIRQIIHSKATGTKVRHTSPTKLESIVVGYPPIDLQNQFAAIVEKVEVLKSRYQQSLTDLESLYGALSQKAFKGELDLSRVALPAERPEIAEEDKIVIEEKQPMEPLFELPAPEKLAVLQTAEGRKSLLGEWLNTWLAQLGDTPLSAQKFMDAARQRLWELAEDEAPDWGVAEYDQLKDWVFEALEQSRLIQGYDDAKNRVQITVAKG